MPTVSLDDGRAAHLARARTEGPAPGVVVIHEIFGLDDDIRRLNDHVAGLGYLALAPDFYAGARWWRSMRSAFRELEAGHGSFFDVIAAARDWLVRSPECSGRIGVLGVSLGGSFALRAAARCEFAAASANYGEVPEDAETILAGACPIVASYGGRDRTLREDPPRLERALAALGIPQDVEVYPHAGHGFLRQRGYPGVIGLLSKINGMAAGPHPSSAADAWRRTRGLFDAYLR